MKGPGLSSSPGPDGRVRFNLTLLSLSFLNSFGVGGPRAAFTKDMPTEVFSRVGAEFHSVVMGRDRLGCFNVPVF